MAEAWTFGDGAGFWWAVMFVLLAGWLPTDVWRWLGVVAGQRINEASPLMRLVRAVATALVAAVIARLVLHPTGALADLPLALRLAAVGFGMTAFLAARNSMLTGILSAQIVLIGGALLLGQA